MSADQSTCLALRVTGKVQGVWYRKHTLEEAVRLGVRGWVRNAPNGDVLIEAAGDPEALRQFTAWCRQGPPMARVDQVEVAEAHDPGYSDFRIIR